MSEHPNSATWIVVAAFNESSVIGQVVSGLSKRGHSIVVVDDGSSDCTAEAATRAGAKVVRHPVNLGQGAALQTGIEYALAKGATFLVTFDADGQHRVADLDVIIAPLRDGRADFSLGSRFLGETKGAPLFRRLLLRGAILFTRLFSGLSLTDTHNGFRGMTRRGAQKIHLRQNRMAHASEILDQISASGLTFVEVPVTIAYSAYSLAKGQKLSDSVLIILDILARGLRK